MTALSMPRFRSIGFMPAATNFMPSRMMDCASTVAVVVPSPAASLVLEATSLTIWAPMFWSLSLSSISLATETPSLVTVGAPNAALQDHVAALGAQGDLDRVGQDVHAFNHAVAGVRTEDDVFSCHVYFS